MPTPFKPRIVRWVDPQTGKRVPAGTPGATRQDAQSPWWWGVWTSRFGKKHKKRLGRTTLKEAERILTQRMAETDREAAGITDQFSRHAAEPITTHVQAWAADLAASGAGKRHVTASQRQVTDVLAEAGVATLRDLEAERVRRAIDQIRRQRDAAPALDPAVTSYTTRELAGVLGIHFSAVRKAANRIGVAPGRSGRTTRYSPEDAAAIAASLRGFGLATANHYLTACKAFSSWCAGPIGKRLPTDPLAALQPWNAETDRRLRRRALTAAQFEAFVEASATGRPFRGITGPQRLVLYTLAANTGLRASELSSLTPASFSWEAGTVTVQATVSKRRREDVLPLRADVAEMMRQYVASQIPEFRNSGISSAGRTEPLWPGTWHLAGGEMVRRDLAAAGIPAVENGRVVDFHALRSLLASFLAAAGVHPRVAQELMRHSDIRLTMGVYTQLNVMDVAGALDALPRLPGRRAEGEKGAG